MSDSNLAWRVEQACASAWPALDEVAVGGWTARLGLGLTRRINSANPQHPGTMLSEAVIDACEALYARKGLPPIFRVPAFIDQAADRRLAGRGYGLEGQSLTLFAPARSLAASADPEVELTRRPTEAWLQARFRISGLKPDGARTYRRVLARLTVAAVFAALRAEDRIVAIAYGAEHGGLLCVDSVATDPGFRGRGLAFRLLRALFAGARLADLEGVCLQVEADNAPAIRLYRSLGVGDQIYGYHYRRGPTA